MEDPLTQIDTILDAYVGVLTEPDQVWPYDVTRALVWLNDHLFTPTCSLNRMKEICRINGNNFSLRFKHYVGLPPVRYISNHRIEAATLLLSDRQLRELPVSEIAFAVGYERVTTFTTAFTKRAGLPPLAWKREQLKTRREN